MRLVLTYFSNGTTLSTTQACQAQLVVTGLSAGNYAGYIDLGNGASKNFNVKGSIPLQMNAGDTVKLQFASDVTMVLNTSSGRNYFSVKQIQGPAQIAASEIITAKRYSSATAWTYNSATKLAWTTSAYDSHGGWTSTSTYTVPAPGKYNVRARANLTSTAASAAERVAYLYVSQTSVIKAYGIYDRAYSTTAREYAPYLDAQLDCIAGDTIEIYGFSNLVTSTNVNNSGSGVSENFVVIERVGGI